MEHRIKTQLISSTGLGILLLVVASLACLATTEAIKIPSLLSWFQTSASSSGDRNQDPNNGQNVDLAGQLANLDQLMFESSNEHQQVIGHQQQQQPQPQQPQEQRQKAGSFWAPFGASESRRPTISTSVFTSIPKSILQRFRAGKEAPRPALPVRFVPTPSPFVQTAPIPSQQPIARPAALWLKPDELTGFRHQKSFSFDASFSGPRTEEDPSNKKHALGYGDNDFALVFDEPSQPEAERDEQNGGQVASIMAASSETIDSPEMQTNSSASFPADNSNSTQNADMTINATQLGAASGSQELLNLTSVGQSNNSTQSSDIKAELESAASTLLTAPEAASSSDAIDDASELSIDQIVPQSPAIESTFDSMYGRPSTGRKLGSIASAQLQHQHQMQHQHQQQQLEHQHEQWQQFGASILPNDAKKISTQAKHENQMDTQMNNNNNNNNNLQYPPVEGNNFELMASRGFSLDPLKPLGSMASVASIGLGQSSSQSLQSSGPSNLNLASSGQNRGVDGSQNAGYSGKQRHSSATSFGSVSSRLIQQANNLFRLPFGRNHFQSQLKLPFNSFQVAQSQELQPLSAAYLAAGNYFGGQSSAVWPAPELSRPKSAPSWHEASSSSSSSKFVPQVGSFSASPMPTRAEHQLHHQLKPMASSQVSVIDHGQRKFEQQAPPTVNRYRFNANQLGQQQASLYPRQYPFPAQHKSSLLASSELGDQRSALLNQQPDQSDRAESVQLSDERPFASQPRRFRSGFYQIEAPKLAAHSMDQAETQLGLEQPISLEHGAQNSDASVEHTDEAADQTGSSSDVYQTDAASNNKPQLLSQASIVDLADDFEQEISNSTSDSPNETKFIQPDKGSQAESTFAAQVGASIGFSQPDANKSANYTKVGKVFNERPAEAKKLNELKSLKHSEELTLYELEMPPEEQPNREREQKGHQQHQLMLLAQSEPGNKPSRLTDYLDTQVYTMPYLMSMHSEADGPVIKLRPDNGMAATIRPNQFHHYPNQQANDPSNIPRARPDNRHRFSNPRNHLNPFRQQQQQQHIPNQLPYLAPPSYRPQFQYPEPNRGHSFLGPATVGQLRPVSAFSIVQAQQHHQSFKPNQIWPQQFNYQQSNNLQPIRQLDTGSSYPKLEPQFTPIFQSIQQEQPNQYSAPNGYQGEQIPRPIASPTQQPILSGAFVIHQQPESNDKTTNQTQTKTEPAELRNSTASMVPIIVESEDASQSVNQTNQSTQLNQPDIQKPTNDGFNIPIAASVFCADKLPGLYADKSQRCKAYYQCAPTGHQMFHCNNQTQFNQNTQNCDWWYNVNCAGSSAGLASRSEEPVQQSNETWTIEQPIDDRNLSMLLQQPTEQPLRANSQQSQQSEPSSSTPSLQVEAQHAIYGLNNLTETSYLSAPEAQAQVSQTEDNNQDKSSGSINKTDFNSDRSTSGGGGGGSTDGSNGAEIQTQTSASVTVAPENVSTSVQSNLTLQDSVTPTAPTDDSTGDSRTEQEPLGAATLAPSLIRSEFGAGTRQQQQQQQQQQRPDELDSLGHKSARSVIEVVVSSGDSTSSGDLYDQLGEPIPVASQLKSSTNAKDHRAGRVERRFGARLTLSKRKTSTI